MKQERFINQLKIFPNSKDNILRNSTTVDVKVLFIYLFIYSHFIYSWLKITHLIKKIIG